MPRRAIDPSPLMKWRLNQRIETDQLIEKTGLSKSIIYRIERGEAISRVKVSQYLSYWGGDLNNLSELPVSLQIGLKIVDEGWAVRLLFQL